MSGVIVLVTDDKSFLGRRYPVSIQDDGQTIPLALGSTADLTQPGVLGGIIDVRAAGDKAIADDFTAVLKAGVPLLLSADSIAAFRTTTDAFSDLWLNPGWMPYFPLRRAVDVVAAAQLMADGAIGNALSCEVTISVGAADGANWENDAPFARSEHEALLFGLDLSERLMGRELSQTTWSRRTGGGHAIALAVHEGAGIVASVAVLPVALAAVPSFSAAVTGDNGRLLLRQPFAPGALTVWDAASRAFRCPALRRPKANVQAPDTTSGGRETLEELEALLAGPVLDNLRSRAQRLTDQTLAVMHLPASNPTGGEPS